MLLPAVLAFLIASSSCAATANVPINPRTEGNIYSFSDPIYGNITGGRSLIKQHLTWQAALQPGLNVIDKFEVVSETRLEWINLQWLKGTLAQC